MNSNMQDNASGTGNGCDLLDCYENCPHELPVPYLPQNPANANFYMYVSMHLVE